MGGVFGAPLAMEALLAFFVESTFLGVWIFGRDRLWKGVHLACLWTAVIASAISACFIIVANSWMQHPVGVELIDGRPQMTDAWAVFANPMALVAYPHAIAGSVTVAGSFLVGIAWHHLWRLRKDGIDTVSTDGQPFVVAPNPETLDGVFMFTAAAVSPGVSIGELMFSLASFTLVYGVLLVVEVGLLTKYTRGGNAAAMPD